MEPPAQHLDYPGSEEQDPFYDSHAAGFSHCGLCASAGIDPSALSNAINQNSGDLKQFFGLLDVFTGGSLYTFGIASMGVYPYITASIVVQLLQGIVPKLGAMSSEGESGRNRLAQITRYITVPLALLQAFGQMALLVQLGAIQPHSSTSSTARSFIPTLAALVSLTAGTMFLVWIGELITENGIGNGISLIIFANIMVRIPQQIGSQLISNSNGTGGSLSTGGASASCSSCARAWR